MVTKFRILSGKIIGSLERVSKILMACARLHNIIIQRNGPCDLSTVGMSTLEEENFLQITPNPAIPLGMSYLPTTPNAEFVFEMTDGISHTRQEIVEWLGHQPIRRPRHNLLRLVEEEGDGSQQEWLTIKTGNNTSFAIEREFISPN
jgi:hypothetical protein